MANVCIEGKRISKASEAHGELRELRVALSQLTQHEQRHAMKSL